MAIDYRSNPVAKIGSGADESFRLGYCQMSLRDKCEITQGA